jgi:hypothetical protein
VSAGPMFAAFDRRMGHALAAIGAAARTAGSEGAAVAGKARRVVSVWRDRAVFPPHRLPSLEGALAHGYSVDPPPDGPGSALGPDAHAHTHHHARPHAATTGGGGAGANGGESASGSAALGVHAGAPATPTGITPAGEDMAIEEDTGGSEGWLGSSWLGAGSAMDPDYVPPVPLPALPLMTLDQVERAVLPTATRYTRLLSLKRSTTASTAASATPAPAPVSSPALPGHGGGDLWDDVAASPLSQRADDDDEEREGRATGAASAGGAAGGADDEEASWRSAHLDAAVAAIRDVAPFEGERALAATRQAGGSGVGDGGFSGRLLCAVAAAQRRRRSIACRTPRRPRSWCLGRLWRRTLWLLPLRAVRPSTLRCCTHAPRRTTQPPPSPLLRLVTRPSPRRWPFAVPPSQH